MNDDDIFRIRSDRLNLAINRYNVRLFWFALWKYGHPKGRMSADEVRSQLSRLWFYVFTSYKIEDFCNYGYLKNKLSQLCLDFIRRQKRESSVLEFVGMELPEMAALARHLYVPLTDSLEDCWKFWAFFPGVQLTDGQKLAVFLSGHRATVVEIINRCQREKFHDMPTAPTSMTRMITSSKAIFWDYYDSE